MNKLIISLLFFLSWAYSQLPNIVIIYTDDQGYGDVSALNPNSKFQTPNMDRIASEGVTFTDGHSSDGVCTPSRYSLLTGRYSWRTTLKNGVYGAEGDNMIAADRLNIASMLKQKGYNTAMIGKWHLRMEFPGTKGNRDWTQPNEQTPYHRGFDYFFGIPASMNYGVLTFLENDRILAEPSQWTTRTPLNAEGTYRIKPPYANTQSPTNNLEVAPSFADSLVLEKFAERTVWYIDSVAQEAKNGKPFFIYMPLTSPHLPHSPGQGFLGISNVALWGDFMIETDFRVGQVLDALDKNGLTDNTLVIFTSDNGAENGYADRFNTYGHASNLDLKGGKRDIYEGGHRVPFLMRWPGTITAGRVVNEPVGQVDLLGTIADIVDFNLADDEGEDSYSLLPALESGTYSTPLRGPLIFHSSRGYFSVRKGDYKLNMFRGSGGSLAPTFTANPSDGIPFELYNMVSDNLETQNIHDANPNVVSDLEQEITNIVLRGRSTLGAAQPNDGPICWSQLETWMPDCNNNYWNDPPIPVSDKREKQRISLNYNILNFNLLSEKEIIIDLLDVSGSPLMKTIKLKLSQGEHRLQIPEISERSDGFFIIKVKIHSKTYFLKSTNLPI